MSNDRLVSDHYDAKPQLSISERKTGRLFKLMTFNNWVKAVLINRYAGKGHRCVDMCCGKGGDLKKWNVAKIAYLLCVDSSDVSVRQCHERYRDIRVASFAADFFTVNCFSSDFLQLPCFRSNSNYQSFDVVSVQFAYHYAFSTKETVRASLKNISLCLKKDGIFMATVLDSDVISERIQQARGLSFGNEIYKVEFESKESFSDYGQKYTFWLYETIDNLPEYMVRIDLLQSLALEYGLELVYRCNFGDFFEENKEKHQDLLFQMMRCNSFAGRLPMSEQEWEVASLYLAIVFRKIK